MNRITVLASAALLVAACSSDALPPGSLVAELEPTTGSQVSGRITFEPMADHVHIRGEVRGLEPGLHGIHVHEKGDCSSGDGKSAGGHYNPTGVAHAGPDAEMRHVGDLGNLEADASGVARYERMDMVVKLEGEHSIRNRGLIVHAGEDDLESQPTGAAGARLACGVIVAAD